MIDRFAVNKYEISAPILSEPKMLQAKNVQYTDIGVRHQMGPQAQALHLPAAPLPAQAAWALASSQPDQ